MSMAPSLPLLTVTLATAGTADDGVVEPSPLTSPAATYAGGGPGQSEEFGELPLGLAVDDSHTPRCRVRRANDKTETPSPLTRRRRPRGHRRSRGRRRRTGTGVPRGIETRTAGPPPGPPVTTMFCLNAVVPSGVIFIPVAPIQNKRSVIVARFPWPT